MAHECEPTTTGGNSTVVNGNEQEPLTRTAEYAKSLQRAEGQQEDQFHGPGWTA